MMNLKEQFERVLNIVPFIMLGQLFITIPCRILNIKNNETSQLVQWIGYVSFHILILLPIYHMVQTVTRCRKSVRDKISELITVLQEKIVKGEQSQANQVLIEELRNGQEFVFTVWFLFPMDRTIILSFVSSIITFSVLLIQLLDKR